jgi:hypothetical protein
MKLTFSKTSIIVAGFLVSFILIFGSACSLSKSEGERQAQIWWDNTIAQCENDYYTKYKGPEVFTEANAMNQISEAYIQFKNPSYDVRPTSLAEKDKLNGIEWHGTIIISFSASLRYYEIGTSSDKKWSSWQEGPLMYSDKRLRELEKPSPYIINFGKIHGKWLVPDTGFTKPQCSEIPKDK